MRHLVTALLVLCFAVRALVPAGWMPSAAGGFAIEICTATGLERAWIDGAGQVHRDDPDGPSSGGDHLCPFATLSAPVVPHSPTVALLPRVFVLDTTARMSGLVRIGQGLPAPPPPARAPPIPV